MAQTPKLCCPTPTLQSPLHPHKIPSSGSSVTSANTSLETLCTPEGDKVFVQFDTSTIAPVALSAIFPSGERYDGDLAALVDCDVSEITFEGQNCNGESVAVEGNKGEIVQVVQAPGQVMTVRICEDDRDFELSCGKDPETGHEVQTAYKITAGAFVLINRWDTVTGEEWTGDPAVLESCGGATIESDPRDACVNGQDLTQWVVKSEGVPTGVVFFTDAAGQLVEVEAGAEISFGQCQTSCAKAPLGVVTSWAV